MKTFLSVCCLPLVWGALSNRKNIERAAKAIENFLGGKGEVITNADGDMILIKGDRKVRFDVKHPHGDRPHFHMEERSSNGRWKDAGPEHRYYFSGRVTVKWIATPNFSSPRHYEIQEDLPAGYYLYIYENNTCVYDFLQDSLELAMEQAKEDFGVSQELWRMVEE